MVLEHSYPYHQEEQTCNLQVQSGHLLSTMTVFFLLRFASLCLFLFGIFDYPLFFAQLSGAFYEVSMIRSFFLLHFCQVHVSSYPLFLFSLFSFFLGRFHLMNKLLHDYCFYLLYVYFETENLSLSFLYFVEMRIYSIVQIYPLSGLGRKV